MDIVARISSQPPHGASASVAATMVMTHHQHSVHNGRNSRMLTRQTMCITAVTINAKRQIEINTTLGQSASVTKYKVEYIHLR